MNLKCCKLGWFSVHQIDTIEWKNIWNIFMPCRNLKNLLKLCVIHFYRSWVVRWKNILLSWKHCIPREIDHFGYYYKTHNFELLYCTVNYEIHIILRQNYAVPVSAKHSKCVMFILLNLFGSILLIETIWYLRINIKLQLF